MGNSSKSQPAQDSFVPHHIDAVPLDEDAPAQTGLAVLRIVHIHRYHPAVIESGDVVKYSVSYDYMVRLIPVQDEAEGIRGQGWYFSASLTMPRYHRGPLLPMRKYIIGEASFRSALVL